MGQMPVFPGNPRQGWQFIIRVDGFDVAYFQKATIPEVTVEVDEFNPQGSVRPTKFGGRFSIADCVLEKGMPADDIDTDAWNWLVQAANTKVGELGHPDDYRRDIEIQHVSRVGEVIQTWVLKEAFCTKISWGDNEGKSDHVVETLTLTVGDVEIV